MKDKKKKQLINTNHFIRRLITLGIIATIAWLLGQSIVPIVMKAILL